MGAVCGFLHFLGVMALFVAHRHRPIYDRWKDTNSLTISTISLDVPSVHSMFEDLNPWLKPYGGELRQSL